MDREEVFSKVSLIIVEIVGVEEEEIFLSSHFMNDLGCDSLLLAELIMSLEDGFDLRISDQEVEKLGTVGDVVEHIIEKNG